MNVPLVGFMIPLVVFTLNLKLNLLIWGKNLAHNHIVGHNWAVKKKGADMKQQTIDRILKFTEDRDWDQFHTPANLAKSISIEAGELLECFQWSDDGYDINEVREELADVIVYCVDMLDKLKLDADEIINAKMDKNEAKYPVDKARGNAKKYNKL